MNNRYIIHITQSNAPLPVRMDDTDLVLIAKKAVCEGTKIFTSKETAYASIGTLVKFYGMALILHADGIELNGRKYGAWALVAQSAKHNLYILMVEDGSRVLAKWK